MTQTETTLAIIALMICAVSLIVHLTLLALTYGKIKPTIFADLWNFLTGPSAWESEHEILRSEIASLRRERDSLKKTRDNLYKANRILTETITIYKTERATASALAPKD